MGKGKGKGKKNKGTKGKGGKKGAKKDGGEQEDDGPPQPKGPDLGPGPVAALLAWGRARGRSPLLALLAGLIGVIGPVVAVLWGVEVDVRATPSLISIAALVAAVMLLLGQIWLTRSVFRPPKPRLQEKRWKEVLPIYVASLVAQAVLWPLSLRAIFIEPGTLVVVTAMAFSAALSLFVFLLVDRRALGGKRRGPLADLGSWDLLLRAFMALVAFVAVPAVDVPVRIDFNRPAAVEEGAPSAGQEEGGSEEPDDGCAHHPGEGVPDEDTERFMAQASEAASADTDGCITETETSGAQVVQRYEGSEALLLGSGLGAGLLRDPMLGAYATLTNGDPTFSALGGQVTNAFPCGDGDAEVQPAVRRGGLIVTLASRPVASGNRPAYTTPTALLEPYLRAFEGQQRIVAAGEAETDGGEVAQTFVDVDEPQRSVELRAPAGVALTEVGRAPAGLTLDRLHAWCTGDGTLPEHLDFTSSG